MLGIKQKFIAEFNIMV